MNEPVYLDYAATTPVDPRVAACMARHLTRDGIYANPASSSHRPGRAARAAVERARVEVAALVGARPAEIVWTSGATESDNLAIIGTLRRPAGTRTAPDRHVVTCATEHPAVLDACRALESEGVAITRLAPGHDGGLDLTELEAALRPGTRLVSIMHVNNETGVVQDIAAIGALTRARGIVLHVDAAQSAGKVPIDVDAMGVNLLSLTAHKVYGPKGVGALFVRAEPRVELAPMLFGGGHEGGLRPGTLATHQIAGMGTAFDLARAALAPEAGRLAALRRRLWQGVSTLGDVVLHGSPTRCAPGILNVGFGGLAAEDLMLALPWIAVSSGSACASGAPGASPVLRAMGISDEAAHGAIRFSVGRFTTDADIDRVLAGLAPAVTMLRAQAAGHMQGPGA